MKRLGTGTILSALLVSFTLAGCVGAAPTAAPRAPGLYGGVHYSYSRSGNLQANVGLPVDWSTKADCVGGPWYRDRVEIVSGALPPGLRIDPANYHIVGVPTRAGTWHLRVRFINVKCAGKIWRNSLTQDLHITTKGSSAPRRIP